MSGRPREWQSFMIVSTIKHKESIPCIKISVKESEHRFRPNVKLLKSIELNFSSHLLHTCQYLNRTVLESVGDFFHLDDAEYRQRIKKWSEDELCKQEKKNFELISD
jgi:hypothetical protein